MFAAHALRVEDADSSARAAVAARFSRAAVMIQTKPAVVSIEVTGTQTGIHLCPDGLQAGYPYACDMYSSGELRYGKALANAMSNPPRPVVP